MGRLSAEETEAIRASSLFDAEWYLETYPDVRALGMDPVEHFLWIGARLKRNPSPRFNTADYLAANRGLISAETNPLLHHERGGQPEEPAAPEAAPAKPAAHNPMSLLGINDHADAISRLAALKRERGPTRNLSAIEAMLHLRHSRVEDARRCWQDYWSRGRTDRAFRNQPHPHLPFDTSGQKQFEVASRTSREGGGGPDRMPKYCVYTAVYGQYDELVPPLFRPDGVDFLCFTDKPFQSTGWDVIVLDPGHGDSAKNSRHLKINPYSVLHDYECSLYVDANLFLLSDVSLMVRTWLAGRAFVAWGHPERSDIYDELETIMAHFRHEPDAIISEYQRYKLAGVPRHTGMLEACFLWRDHRDPDVKRLMDMWRQEYGTHSKRDQPALSYCMWKTGVRPQLLPPYLGNTRHSDFFVKTPHLQERPAARPVPWARQHQHDHRSPNGLANADLPPRPGVSRPTRRRIAWLYREEARSVASTVMRGSQLSQMYRGFAGDAAEVAYLNETQTDDLRDFVLILTKGFVKCATAQEIEELRTRNNVICADYIDEPIRQSLDELIDVYIASSVRQLLYLRQEKPEKLARLITHHVDPALNGTTGPSDYLNIGYYGEIVNAKHAAELQGRIDFCLTDTKSMNGKWVHRLRHSNMHYAVRQHRDIDGFKPFLKGFTAAHCNANVLVPAAESDARYYLGSDYPYILGDDSLKSVLDTIAYAEDTFGGPVWQEGLEFMRSVRERSSPGQICSEIEGLLAEL